MLSFCTVGTIRAYVSKLKFLPTNIYSYDQYNFESEFSSQKLDEHLEKTVKMNKSSKSGMNQHIRGKENHYETHQNLHI